MGANITRLAIHLCDGGLLSQNTTVTVSTRRMSHCGSEPEIGTAEPRHDVAPMRHKTGTKNRMGGKSTLETTKIATY